MSPPSDPLQSIKVKYAGIEIWPPGTTFGPRRMVDYEFVWIIQGGGSLQYDDHAVPAQADTVILGRPGMTDRYDWGKRSRTINAYCHFEMKLSRRGWPAPEQWPLFHRLPPEDLFRPLFRYVLSVDALPNPLRARLMRQSLGLMLECFISGKFKISPEPHRDLPPPIENALKVISDLVSKQPAPPMTLPQLAKAAYVSPRHLCRIFRDTLGLTPLECVSLARLERASMFLGRSNLPIKQVADLTGFSSAYYFSKAFRRAYQMSPRAYRNAVRTGDVPVVNPIVRVIRSDFLSKIA